MIEIKEDLAPEDFSRLYCAVKHFERNIMTQRARTITRVARPISRHRFMLVMANMQDRVVSFFTSAHLGFFEEKMLTCAVLQLKMDEGSCRNRVDGGWSRPR